jgi:hypothetical protein
MLKASEAEQIAWINAYLARGMPVKDPDAGILTMLVLNKSTVALPLIERKIEQILRSPSGEDPFTEASVDPNKFITLAADAIAYAGDEEALRQIRNLIRADESRFLPLVGKTLQEAEARRNPFFLAYAGLGMGDSALDRGISDWTDAELGDRFPALFGGGRILRWDNVPASRLQEVWHWWAEAMVARYGGVPTEDEWRSDPIASRLKPSLAASLHDEIIRRTSELVEKPQKH